MYKVMVVDDEIIVRRGIMTSIDWPSHGIAITAEARNGKEALIKLQSHPVHLILADIRMPVMTGIELARAVKPEYPDIELILLSGYEEFQYAKEAMSLGIRHYLLKPVQAEKLVELLVEYRDRERHKRLTRQRELIRNMLFNEQLPHMKSKLMHKLLDRRADAGEIREQAATLRIPLDGPAYRVLVVKADGNRLFAEHMTRKEQEAMAFAFLNIVEETLLARFPGFVSYAEPNTVIGLINLRPETPVGDVCEAVRTNLSTYLRLPVSVRPGRSVHTLTQIADSYEDALGALSCGACRETDSPGASAEEAKVHSRLVKEAVRYAMTHYGEPIGLSETAEHVCVTPAHLSKVFKEEMGENFMRWLNRIRVEEARRLLDSTWLRTYEIAEKVGFRDYKYFSSIFRTYTGCSPREYRNRRSESFNADGRG
jgi:two-component system response regulator YesN